MLAHELRNPLAAVANATAVLKGGTPDETGWATGVIEHQGRHLAHLIDDLLDVSRISTGKIHLRRQVVDTAVILDRACESARQVIADRHHTFEAEYESDQLWIDADPTRIEQVILNLLTNAAKYTHAGGRIALSAKRLGEEVCITVRDNGIGIAPQRLPEMFQLFAQGERSIARSEGGLGIGLTIVQKLVEMHGGHVRASSRGPNRGSTFTVFLPVAGRVSASSVKSAGHASSDEPQLRILIVDDNVDTAQGLVRLLKRAGHLTTLAHDGIRAIELAAEWSPDCVILDIGLPGMDGFEVARRLRKEPASHDAVLVAVTGYGQPEDRQRALEAGCDHHLVKPVDFNELKKRLRRPTPASGG